jgi:hypothetical protein
MKGIRIIGISLLLAFFGAVVLYATITPGEYNTIARMGYEDGYTCRLARSADASNRSKNAARRMYGDDEQKRQAYGNGFKQGWQDWKDKKENQALKLYPIVQE